MALSYSGLWLLSWWAALGQGWGKAESAHEPGSRWFYTRRLLLAALSLVGVLLVAGQPLANYGWNLSPWLPVALLVGGVLALGNRGGFVPDGWLPMVLALFHTFATELYFRGYLFHHLSGSLGTLALPLSALLYGGYYLTVHTVWVAGWRGRLIGVVTFTLLGLVFAGFYTLAGGFLGAWLAHFAAVIRWNVAIRRERPGEAA
ncbi:MAG: CPBP family glutamic-type intramembrane protease [Chloroflexaceae bacterium]|nr:CPBP family glutamic-type intramembrane protease [Chloroflexaceae bacterium]